MSEFRKTRAFADEAGNTINLKQVIASIRHRGESEFRKVRAYMLKDGSIITMPEEECNA